MNTITSKQLYDLIASGKLNVMSLTNRYMVMPGMVDVVDRDKFMEDLKVVAHAGMFDIVNWKYYISTKGLVTMTADLNDVHAGSYIELMGEVSGGMSVKDFEKQLL